MGSLSNFKLNRAGVRSYLDGGYGVEAMLEAEAQAVLGRAQSGAPVDSGAYRDNIHIVTEHTDRMVKRVVADVDYALVIEANTGNMARSL